MMNPNISVTYMQMFAADQRERRSILRENEAVKHAHGLGAVEYLYLYEQVGRPWRWAKRRSIELERVLKDAHIDVLLLYCSQAIAGLSELDRSQFPDIEIKYFGLMPQFIGRGLGGFFLDEIVRIAWAHKPNRLWLHTDEYDHPKAIPLYKSRGFQIYKQQIEKAHDGMERSEGA